MPSPSTSSRQPTSPAASRRRVPKRRPPPLTFKPSAPTEYEQKVQREEERQRRADLRREKARIRMAMKRAALRLRPTPEQEAAAERERAYQATYREKQVPFFVSIAPTQTQANRHRENLRLWEAQRRVDVYINTYGAEAYRAYTKARRDRRRQAKAKLRAKAGYFDDTAAGTNTDKGTPSGTNTAKVTKDKKATQQAPQNVTPVSKDDSLTVVVKHAHEASLDACIHAVAQFFDLRVVPDLAALRRLHSTGAPNDVAEGTVHSSVHVGLEVQLVKVIRVDVDLPLLARAIGRKHATE
ncbi:hypothetical protein C8F04DRAFT_1191980 [Mycena alexandri]|uniref:Uncharacterized protein n=1 Tax=Mycena alexandri TaxID=1745969 RepID=A0AAD6WU29_9AGAR|nr:hypothetical protein C8F04DRAFT_1191980 [Mycena alexandri]